MRKIISLGLVIFLLFGLCACKKKNEDLSVASPTDLATKTDIATLTDAVVSATTPEDKCKHQYIAATCTKAKRCKFCDEISGEPLGHKWQKATCISFKTCKVCKAIEGMDYGEHAYKNGYCTVCNKKDPNFGSLTSHNWQLLKSERLITVSFLNNAYSEAVVKDVAKMSDSEYETAFAHDGGEESIVKLNGKEWYAIDGRGLDISYIEENGTVTIAVTDSGYPQEDNRLIVLKRVGKTSLKVTKCTLKSRYWKIRKGDVLTAVTEK